ncbi:MAG: serine acetyltransferase [Planctomycetes bacterium]|nr:serine acetyltransferase [Planctomycetota bacterium]
MSHPEIPEDQITARLIATSEKLLSCSDEQVDCKRLPSNHAIEFILGKLVHLLFPRYHYERVENESSLRLSIPKTMSNVFEALDKEINRAFNYNKEQQDKNSELNSNNSRQIALEMIEALPEIRKVLECDLEEVLNHDPAAKGIEEVLIAYPGFEALTVHRLAHYLHKRGVPLIPRMMSEIVHRDTGIDIHPAATIAPYCSIDHGTGLIVGETTIIGQHVNLFHNVTLGAKSVTPEFRGCKRHPTIGNNVIIYPGATVLGDVFVGDNTIIGGNVFLLEDCPENSKIYAKPPEMIRRTKKN